MTIASDGLWDVVSENVISPNIGRNSLEVANALLTRAQQNGSRDNISILVVWF
jgi:serine/threonine protein phosphatase PrpC